MAGVSPQITWGWVAVGVGAGVSVGVMVEVGSIEAVTVCILVGGSILFKVPQPFTSGRSDIKQSSKTILLKR